MITILAVRMIVNPTTFVVNNVGCYIYQYRPEISGRFYYNLIPELAVYSLHHYSAVALAAAVVVGGFADYLHPVFG